MDEIDHALRKSERVQMAELAMTGPDADVVEALRPRQPASVLDVGCGDGALTAYIGRVLRSKVVGVDSSRTEVAAARAHGIDAILADAERLPFPDHSFDCAVAAWSLHLVDDLDRALAEIARVLVPDGRLVCMTGSDLHMHEVWQVLGVRRIPSRFSAENGRDRLARHFHDVSCSVSHTPLVFSRTEDVLAYATAAYPGSEPFPSRIVIDVPLTATTISGLLVADRPARHSAPHHGRDAR